MGVGRVVLKEKIVLEKGKKIGSPCRTLQSM